MKIVTICGSFKFQKEMLEIGEKLSLKGYCVLHPIYPVNINTKLVLTEEQIGLLKEGHLKRIEISDAIFVCNINGYVGESTKNEIEYAKKLNKEIIYYDE